MLRHHAVLLAWPRAQRGLLQDDAVDARSFCAAILGAWRSPSAGVLRPDALRKYSSRLRVPGAHPCSTLPRPACSASEGGPFASSHLVHPSSYSQFCGHVCFRTVVSTLEGRTMRLGDS